MTARSRFFRAPATISLALALEAFTIATMGYGGSVPRRWATFSSRGSLPPTVATMTPRSRNRSATFAA